MSLCRWGCCGERREGTWTRNVQSLNTHLTTKALKKGMQRLSTGRHAGRDVDPNVL